MKYSIVLLGFVSSIRSGTTVRPWCTARSTSRWICCEEFALALNTSTMALDCSIASMIDSAQDAPGRMSRGAIQHRTPRASSNAQTASAVTLSRDE